MLFFKATFSDDMQRFAKKKPSLFYPIKRVVILLYNHLTDMLTKQA